MIYTILKEQQGTVSSADRCTMNCHMLSSLFTAQLDSYLEIFHLAVFLWNNPLCCWSLLNLRYTWLIGIFCFIQVQFSAMKMKSFLYITNFIVHMSLSSRVNGLDYEKSIQALQLFTFSVCVCVWGGGVGFGPRNIILLISEVNESEAHL